MNPLALPASVDTLPNDPYRSLAGQAEEAGGYLNDGTNFCQFQWANYFRDAKLLAPNASSAVGSITFSWCQANPYDSDCFDDQHALQAALPKALAMCKSKNAQQLCGFGKGVVTPADCGKNGSKPEYS
eukprot:TRINITY_DN18782_c0_g1_i2.p1 TRINITY_DN18782_c0_g1~~TRINITY_DN18782_c0_g1_i2.p1  ORF type:complete len:128 (-),score=27.14 TRINITY_DN18782_c0_g1_i2:425-808(-)